MARRLVRTRARKVALVVAVLVLVPVGCFAPGGLWDERPARARYLIVGGSESEPVLLVREDPDSCGDPVLERTG
ncbi:hypothetical protein ACFVZW_31885 [Streptomyces sp. NPDC059567]|uniref:hypothetical protein n=1 Tax=Streptomyces sp. NPDC059567 TaxID=3346867 RepID=UPI00368FC0C1